MCLVFRTIVLLSLNWWVISASAQEKQVIQPPGGVPIPLQTPMPGVPPISQGPVVGQPVPVVPTSQVPTTQPVPGGTPTLSQIPTIQQSVGAPPILQTPVVGQPALEPTMAQIPTTQPVPAGTPVPSQTPTIQPPVGVSTASQELIIGQPVLGAPAVQMPIVQPPVGVTTTPQAPTIQPSPTGTPQTPSVTPSTEMKPPVQEIKKPEEPKKTEETKKPEEVKKEDKPKAPEPEEADIKGIDTADLDEPRGNWLFKKIWWERAENKYEKVRSVFEAILEARILFFTKRSTADKDLFAPFYFEIGMNNGELQETVSQLIGHIEKERKKESEMNAAERKILQVLISEKKSLESINASVLAVNKLDIDIDETLKKLMDQINLARKYEQEAWRNFKEIGRVLSDKKARELFYQMDTAYHNIKEIHEYVGQALVVHLDRVVGTAKSQIERIKAAIDSLNKKGHDLRELAEKISEGVYAQQELEQEEEEEIEPEEELGFFARTFSAIKSGVAAVWDSIIYVVKLPFSWFSKSNEQAEEE